MPATFKQRTVSPLHFESLRPDPDDILCPGSDVEETLERHEAKRRRVEQAGEEYLRGRPLYIASARLKGPFLRGWKSPYSIKERRVEVCEGRSRPSRRQSPTTNVTLEIAPGCKDVPIEISSHETEASIPTPAAHSHCGRFTKYMVNQAASEHLRSPVQEGENLTRPSSASMLASNKAASKTEQLDVVEVPISQGRGWLKSAARKNGIARKSLKSPTPSPAPRPREQSSDYRSRTSSNVADARTRKTSRSVASSDGRGSRASSEIQKARLDCPSDLRAPANFELLRTAPVKEAKLSSVSPDTRKAHKTVKELSQLAAKRARNDWGHSEAKKLTEAAIARAQKDSTIANEPKSQSHKPDQISGALHASEPIFKQSVHALPSSTNLPEFEYHHRSREASRSPERRSFKEDLEAAKKKARAERKWRLSFTASGKVKGRSPSLNPPGLRLSQRNLGPKGSQSAEQSPVEDRKGIDKSVPREEEETTSRPIEALPEAQIVQEPALKMPSGPSTGMLETDKLSTKIRSTEEGDSYFGLSTQAAMLKAQNSFRNDLVSPTTTRIDPPLPRMYDNAVQDAVDRNSEEWEIVDYPLARADFLTPGKNTEPLNTQAMIDAISPFAETTIKNRHALDPRPSSTPSSSNLSSPPSPAAPNFETTSLSMSTSPSPIPVPADNNPPIPLSALSKPPSSITSFSIAPNGTSTEVFQQDGQAQQGYLVGDLDLDAAIEEAGSFLGEWNLEKEVRNQDRSTLGSKTSTAKASRSH
ncbi:MAG: hypothetical protein Q9209_004563 [Squamulea sp. 1 TL-2023]